MTGSGNFPVGPTIGTPNIVFHSRKRTVALSLAAITGGIMSNKAMTTAAVIGLAGMLTSHAQAQSAGNQDAEIALLKQQLRLMEQKLDKLEKQTAVNTTAAAKANAKVDAGISARKAAKPVDVADANAAYPLKGPVAPFGAVVSMPN